MSNEPADKSLWKFHVDADDVAGDIAEAFERSHEAGLCAMYINAQSLENLALQATRTEAAHMLEVARKIRDDIELFEENRAGV